MPAPEPRAKTCGECRHWQEEVPAFDGEDPGDRLGSCRALDTLPFALRWGGREAVWTRASEPDAARGESCDYWQGILSPEP